MGSAFPIENFYNLGAIVMSSILASLLTIAIVIDYEKTASDSEKIKIDDIEESDGEFEESDGEFEEDERGLYIVRRKHGGRL